MTTAGSSVGVWLQFCGKVILVAAASSRRFLRKRRLEAGTTRGFFAQGIGHRFSSRADDGWKPPLLGVFSPRDISRTPS